MADENKPAFYPRVGNIKAKNFRSAKPMPFIDDERAMELPQYSENIRGLGGVDLSVPTKQNLELNRRITQRDADLMRQVQADRSIPEKLAGGLQAGRFMGSALTQAINSLPTRIAKGDEAADKFIQERIYKPEQPLAYEYAQDIGDFLEKLETEYKIPPVLPEAVALQYLTAPATSQATRAAGRGAEQAGRAMERGMEPVVRGALEQGGLPREMALGMGANTQSNVVKPSGKGANWLDGKRGSVEAQLGKMKMADYTTPEQMAEMQKSIDTAKRIMGDDPEVQRTVGQMENELSTAKRNNAINSWIDSNLRNYVKNQMATPDDPVRKLAEEGILHMAPYGEQGVVSSRLMNKRMGLGQDPLGMGRSDPARFWERMSDISVDAYPAGSYKHGSLDESLLADNPWLQKIPDETMIYSGKGLGGDLGFDHIVDVLRQDVREGRIRPEQLNKVSMEQAVRRTYEYDQEMAKKMAETQAKITEGMPLVKEYPEGYKWIELSLPKASDVLPEGWTMLDPKGGVMRAVNPVGDRVIGNDMPELIKNLYYRHPDTPGNPRQMLEDALKYEGDTMGHCVGGYCPDVIAGSKRIFSLRDAKGEPHVTIETGKAQGRTNYDDMQNIYNQAQQEANEKNFPTTWEFNNFYNDRVKELQFALIDKQKAEMPERIVQIKGKGNAKPKEDYLPFVQDFVKSGKWSDIGDFKNTGLIREGNQIMTPAEHADWLLKQLGNPPAEGMKAGGKVSISNNPDAMMLELNNQKMAKGGLTKLLRAAPKSKAEIDVIARRMAPQLLGEFVRGEKGTQSVAGKTQKQFAKEKEMVHDIRPTGAERPLPKEVDIEELKDQVMVGIAGDPTISGQTLYSVDGVPLDSPSPQHGGPFYGLGRDDAFWASGLSAANRVQNVAREASEQYDLPVLGNYVMMGPDSINYAQHYADANLAAIDLNKMNRAQVEAFNNLVREGYPYKKKGEDFMRQRVFPAFPGIENPSEAYLHFSIDPELRKYFNALMQMPTVTEKYSLPSGIDIRHAVTEPDLRDLEIGVTGKSIGRLRPEVSKLGLSEHPTYSHDIPGEFIGSSKYPVPYELSFPDTVKSVRENPKQAPQEFGSFKYVGPRQVIDQQLIDEIKQYQEMIKKYTGKKEGGYIKKPAAYLNGDEFVNAAKKYGIKDSMNNLNKIVDLVNKGLSVDDAARQVADSGTHKAAGGAIRGDDLILEERPL